MTRINLVSPSYLSHKHLVAEYHELPRVFSLVRKSVEKGLTPRDIRIPDTYTRGRGHVVFFYNKLKWLDKRRATIVKEMKLRSYKPQYVDSMWLTFGDIPEVWWKNWKPSIEEIKASELWLKSKDPEYYGK